MSLGLLLSGRRDAAEAVALARGAEAAGFDEIWISEDYFDRGAFAVAGAVAASTRSVRVGIGVINPWTRHPVLSAMEIAGLDEVSAGRAVLGLGSSNKTWMHDRLGLEYDRPLDALAAMTTSIRTLLRTGKVAGSDGQHQVDLELSFEPRRPDVPIVWGVKGPRALRTASEHADGVLLGLLSSPDYIRWAKALVPRLHLRSYVAVACHRDASVARDALRSTVAKYLGAHGRNAVTERGGLDPDLAMSLRQAWLEGRDARTLVTDRILTRFALAGDPDDCREGVSRFREAGLDHIIVLDRPERDPDGLLSEVGFLADP
jgi:5,10-methylenetetrahydromethanopterin reductase